MIHANTVRVAPFSGDGASTYLQFSQTVRSLGMSVSQASAISHQEEHSV